MSSLEVIYNVVVVIVQISLGDAKFSQGEGRVQK
jgi:hypothetical protein